MGWVFGRPWLVASRCMALDVRHSFLVVCWMQAQQILAALPAANPPGFNAIDPQNPWVAAVQLARAWALYAAARCRPCCGGLLPVAALAWVVISGIGRSLVLKRHVSQVGVRLSVPSIDDDGAAGGMAGAAGLTLWGWFRSIQWVRPRTLPPAASPIWWVTRSGRSFFRWRFFTRGRW